MLYNIDLIISVFFVCSSRIVFRIHDHDRYLLFGYDIKHHRVCPPSRYIINHLHPMFYSLMSDKTFRCI